MTSQAYALQQTAAPMTYTVNPGDTQTLQWGLVSDEEIPIKIELHAEGPGSELLTFPETIDLQPHQMIMFDITVNIPQDHQNNIELNPAVYALQKGDDSKGGVVVNVQMRKDLSIKIGDVPEVKAEITPPNEAEIVVDPEPTGESESTGTQFVTESEEKSEKKGGGCLIATAAYGSELAPQIQQLRELRDNQLLQTKSGTSFMDGFNQFYYSFSPTIADWERENPAFKEFVKISLTPMISSLSILNYVDIDSEAEVLGYGVSLIILNAGMYFVAPAIVVVGIRKKLKQTI